MLSPFFFATKHKMSSQKWRWGYNDALKKLANSCGADLKGLKAEAKLVLALFGLRTVMLPPSGRFRCQLPTLCPRLGRPSTRPLCELRKSRLWRYRCSLQKPQSLGVRISPERSLSTRTISPAVYYFTGYENSCLAFIMIPLPLW